MDKPKILFFENKSGGVSCKIKLPGNGSFRYHKGMGRFIRRNKDSDFREYPLIVSFGSYYDLLRANSIKESAVEIDPKSVDVFYGYEHGDGAIHTFVNPTRKRVGQWWGCDCPNLIRYETNKFDERSYMGLKVLVFENILVEWSYHGTYIDSTITKEEVEIFGRDREYTSIYKEMQNVLKAREVDAEHAAELKRQITSYENRIQEVIDHNKFVILNHVRDMFNIRPDGKMVEKNYGLDCGFLNIFTQNKDFNDKKDLLKNVMPETGRVNWLNLQLPVSAQSLTIQKKVFEKVAQIVLQDLGETLYCRTMLD